MNTNFLHNIINVAIAAVAALSVPEVLALFPPEMGVKIVGVLGGVKLVINAIRDGFAGMVKNQPPVK